MILNIFGWWMLAAFIGWFVENNLPDALRDNAFIFIVFFILCLPLLVVTVIILGFMFILMLLSRCRPVEVEECSDDKDE